MATWTDVGDDWSYVESAGGLIKSYLRRKAGTRAAGVWKTVADPAEPGGGYIGDYASDTQGKTAVNAIID